MRSRTHRAQLSGPLGSHSDGRADTSTDPETARTIIIEIGKNWNFSFPITFLCRA